MATREDYIFLMNNYFESLKRERTNVVKLKALLQILRLIEQEFPGSFCEMQTRRIRQLLKQIYAAGEIEQLLGIKDWV